MADTRRGKLKRPWVTDVGIVAGLAVVGLVVWGWIAGVRSPAENAEALLLATGTEAGVPLYEPGYYSYEPDQKQRTAPRASLIPGDLVVAHAKASDSHGPGTGTDEADDGPLAEGGWARIYAVHCPSGASPRTELSWPKSGRMKEFVAVRLDAVPGVSADGDSLRVSLREYWSRQSYLVRQYDTEVGAVISLTYVDCAEHCVYLVNENGGVRWMFWAAYAPTSWILFPAFRVVPECRGAEDVPDIVAFQPPVGLVCRRWDGERFGPALPRLREVPLMVGLLLQGYIWWLSVLVALTPVYLLGLRHVMAPGKALALMAWWGIFLGVGYVTPDFLHSTLGAIMLGVLAALAVWIVGTYRRREVSLGRLGLSVVLTVVCSAGLLFWLLVVYGHFEVHGIGVP